MSRTALLFLSLLVLGWTACGGVGEVDPPEIAVSPTELVFDDQFNVEQFRILGIRNEGESRLVVTAIDVDVSTDFVTVLSPGRIELEPDQEAQISVRYLPTRPEATTGRLIIRSNDPTRGALDVPVNGQQPRPALLAAPASHDFGVVPRGDAARQRFLLQNIGSSPLIICRMFLNATGEFASDIDARLAAEGVTDTNRLAIGDYGLDGFVNRSAFEFEVTYTPAVEIQTTTDVLVEFDRTGDPNGACQADRIESARIPVRGTGGQAFLRVAPCPLDFGSSAIDFTNRRTMTVENLGNVPLEVYNIRLDPVRTSSDFRLGSLPSFPTAIATSGSTAFVVEYTPDTQAADAGIVQIEHSGPGGRQTTECTIAGVGVPNRCPTAVVRGRILQDEQNRVGNEIDWAAPLQDLVLDATASFDEDADPLTDYEWEVVDKPVGVVNGLRPWSGAPENPAYRQFFLPLSGRYVFALRVRDAAGCESEAARLTVFAIPDEAITIELTWRNPDDPDESDTEGADVDLHLVKMGKGPWFDNTFDCYFANGEPLWSPELPSLDIDDRDGAGPETIQLDNPQDCQTYAIGVHYFRRAYGTTFANVRVYINGSLVAEFLNRRMENDDDFWDVARIHWQAGDAEVFRVNELFTNFDSASNISPQPTQQMIDRTDLCGDF